MAGKSPNKNKKNGTVKPKVDREKLRQRTMSYIFLGLSVVLILSMLLSAVSR
jgi:hypothetical protein